MKKSMSLKNPKLRNPILLMIASMAIIALWHQYFFTNAKLNLTVLQKRHDEKQNLLRTILSLKPQLSSLKEQQLKSQVKLDSLKSIFPDQKEVPKLIREINAVARASGIITTRFNPMADVEKEYYVENRYRMSIEGGYHELADFFAFLANFSLIINLTSVNIVTSSTGSSEQSQEQIENEDVTVTSSFEMTTFSSKK